MLSVLLLAAGIQDRPFPLVDEANKDKSFVAFRETLIAALQKGNTAWVDARIDPKIRYTFGDNDSKSAMFEQWRSQPDGIKGFYQELLETVKLGGKYEGKSFWAPYVYACWPETVDAFEHGAIVGDKVPVYDGTVGERRMVGTLSWEIVKLLPVETPVPENKGWQHIEYHGRPAWVQATKTRSSVGYRACFTKVNGSWMLTAFIAGD